MAVHYNPRITLDGLALYYDAKNFKSYPGSGTTWFDLSKNSRDTTSFVNMDATNFNSEGFFTFNSGVANERMNVPEIASGDATIEAWFTSDSDLTLTQGVYGNNQHFRIYKEPTVSSDYYVAGYADSDYVVTAADHNVVFWAQADGGGSIETVKYPALTQGRWIQVVGTMQSNSGLQLFINGNKVGDTSHNVTYLDGTNTAAIGDTYAGAGNPLKGKVAIVRHYTRILSPEEVFANYIATRGRFGI